MSPVPPWFIHLCGAHQCSSVDGGIHHLPVWGVGAHQCLSVEGGIHHLPVWGVGAHQCSSVEGGIHHLPVRGVGAQQCSSVDGGIHHLPVWGVGAHQCLSVEGGIHHLPVRGVGAQQCSSVEGGIHHLQVTQTTEYLIQKVVRQKGVMTVSVSPVVPRLKNFQQHQKASYHPSHLRAHLYNCHSICWSIHHHTRIAESPLELEDSYLP